MSDNRRHTCKLDACHGHIGPPCRQAKIGDNLYDDVDDGVDSGDGGDGDGYDGGAPGLRAWASRETAGARVDDGEIRSQRWPAQDQACCMQGNHKETKSLATSPVLAPGYVRHVRNAKSFLFLHFLFLCLKKLAEQGGFEAEQLSLSRASGDCTSAH